MSRCFVRAYAFWHLYARKAKKNPSKYIEMFTFRKIYQVHQLLKLLNQSVKGTIYKDRNIIFVIDNVHSRMTKRWNMYVSNVTENVSPPTLEWYAVHKCWCLGLKKTLWLRLTTWNLALKCKHIYDIHTYVCVTLPFSKVYHW